VTAVAVGRSGVQQNKQWTTPRGNLLGHPPSPTYRIPKYVVGSLGIDYVLLAEGSILDRYCDVPQSFHLKLYAPRHRLVDVNSVNFIKARPANPESSENLRRNGQHKKLSVASYVLAVCVCLFKLKQEVLCVLFAPDLDRTDAAYKTLCGTTPTYFADIQTRKIGPFRARTQEPLTCKSS
jgi:hypothetical protein